jgi:hypothetical protein
MKQLTSRNIFRRVDSAQLKYVPCWQSRDCRSFRPVSCPFEDCSSIFGWRWKRPQAGNPTEGCDRWTGVCALYSGFGGRSRSAWLWQTRSPPHPSTPRCRSQPGRFAPRPLGLICTEVACEYRGLAEAHSLPHAISRSSGSMNFLDPASAPGTSRQPNYRPAWILIYTRRGRSWLDIRGLRLSIINKQHAPWIAIARVAGGHAPMLHPVLRRDLCSRKWAPVECARGKSYFRTTACRARILSATAPRVAA